MAEQGLDIIIRAIDQASGVLKGVTKDLKGVGDPATTKGVDAAGASLASLGTIAKGFLAAGTLTAIAGGLKDSFDATMKWGESVDLLGDMFGMSGQAASSWSVAMQHVGLSVQEGSMQLNYFTRMLSEAGEKMAAGEVTPFSAALDKLGVSAQGAGGGLKTFDALMPEIMDAFSKLPVGVESTAVAMDLFGARGGSKFLDFLRQGSAGLLDADAKARAFGLSMSTMDANKVEELGFKLNDLGMRFEGIKYSIGIGLVDPLLSALEKLDLMERKIQGLASLGPLPNVPTFGAIPGAGGGMALSTMPGASTLGAPTWSIDQGGLWQPTSGTFVEPPFGDAGARWGGAARGLKGQLSLTQLGMDYTALLQSMAGGGASGGALGGGASSALGGGSDFASLLARAFGGNLGAAQGWQGAFASQHGGAAAGITDIRDKMAGDAFFSRTGRAATQQEWEARYYSGGFEGEDKTGLDAIFGPAGTLSTKLDEQQKAAQSDADRIIAAFRAETSKTLTVTIAGGRITDPPNNGNSGSSGRRDNTPP